MHPWHIIWLVYILFLHQRNDSFTLKTQKKRTRPYVCHTWFSILSCNDLINQFCATDVFIFFTGMPQVYTLNIVCISCKHFHFYFCCFSTLVILRFRNNFCQSYAIFGTAQNCSLCKFWRFLPHIQNYPTEQAGN